MKIVILLLSFFYSSVVFSAGIACHYTSKDSPELVESKKCLTTTNSFADNRDALIWKSIAINASYNEFGLGHLYSAEGIFYFQENGKTMRTVRYDNGPDYFSEGLVRTVKDHKYGFMDKNLNIVIERKFDFVFPFENGKAKVCMGCKKLTDGEHSWYEGGVFYYINQLGEKVE